MYIYIYKYTYVYINVYIYIYISSIEKACPGYAIAMLLSVVTAAVERELSQVYGSEPLRFIFPYRIVYLEVQGKCKSLMIYLYPNSTWSW